MSILAFRNLRVRLVRTLTAAAGSHLGVEDVKGILTELP